VAIGLLLLPIVTLALGIAAKKIPQSRLTTYTLLMAAFGMMIAIAIAYARGRTGSGPAERYFDFLTIYLLASAFSLLLIQRSSSRFMVVFGRGLAVFWVAMCLLAVPYHLKVSKFQLNDRAKLVPIQDDIMARYSVSYDPAIFEKRVARHVPFPRASTLEDFMARLKRTDTLPYTLQPSTMSLQSNSDGFIRDGVPEPISHHLYRGLEHVLGTYNLDAGGASPTGEHRSEVFVAKRPYVMLPVSGEFGHQGLSLSLIGETNGKVVEVNSKVRRSHRARKWREIIVKAPDTKYRILAKDESPSLWFAYAAPRSVGRLSFAVDRLIQQGHKVWRVGLLLIFLVLMSQFARIITAKRSEKKVYRDSNAT